MNIDFSKNTGGLIPAIIQDSETKTVLMLGYMNAEAYQKTIETQKVTFFSRSKQRLWIKGEESGNFLNLVDIKNDCDGDTLLIQAKPVGPTCHTGADTCWQTANKLDYGFISALEDTIELRKNNADSEKSYIAS
jgi:phosphoribosyl-ATP pyrophosphohydrolase/phosphoribosyl-AMP cyclohydrolase